MITGLTGKYCAGKNHIAALLTKRGFPVLDVDVLGHSVIEIKKEELAARFGEDIITKRPGDIPGVNRRLLGEKVFGNEQELAALEAIIHPEVNNLTLQWIKEQKGKNCIINAALLHKSVVFTRLDCIILVNAPWFVRLLRAKKRENLSWIEIFKRFSSQRKFTAQYLAGNADIYRVENSSAGFWAGRQRSSAVRLERRIDEILEKAGL